MTKYTNFILTVIAILLTLHLVKPWFIPGNADAYGERVDVNIEAVGGKRVGRSIFFDKGLPVFITGVKKSREKK
jgi:hypothetical protein